MTLGEPRRGSDVRYGDTSQAGRGESFTSNNRHNRAPGQSRHHKYKSTYSVLHVTVNRSSWRRRGPESSGFHNPSCERTAATILHLVNDLARYPEVWSCGRHRSALSSHRLPQFRRQGVSENMDCPTGPFWQRHVDVCHVLAAASTACGGGRAAVQRVSRRLLFWRVVLPRLPPAAPPAPPAGAGAAPAGGARRRWRPFGQRRPSLVRPGKTAGAADKETTNAAGGRQAPRAAPVRWRCAAGGVPRRQRRPYTFFAQQVVSSKQQHPRRQQVHRLLHPPPTPPAGRLTAPRRGSGARARVGGAGGCCARCGQTPPPCRGWR